MGLKKKIALLLSLVLFAGCGAPVENGHQTGDIAETESAVGLETEPVLDYEIPTLLPGVLLSQAGYSPVSEKIAVVCGTKLPDQFKIVDAVTEETVYVGRLEIQREEEAGREEIGYGDFTEFTSEGEYYVECDIVGCSYPFVIKDSLYQDLMAQGISILSDKAAELAKEDVTEVCRSVSMLLLSFELYAPVYTDGVEEGTQPEVIALLKRYADWLLTCQDAETGAVLFEGTPMPEQTAWLSAALAKFSYTYQKYDSVYATACLQAADRAWKYLDKQEKIAEERAMQEILFFAAAELYRAAGKYSYHAAVKELGASLTLDARKEAQSFGTLTYVATKRRVDVKLCSTLLGVLLSEAESIAEKAKENDFMVGRSLKKETISQVLWDAVVVSVIDYVITNNEYASVLEHYHGYLSGANELAHCYVYGIEEEAWAQGIGADAMNTAKYIMLLSEIMSHEQEE